MLFAHTNLREQNNCASAIAKIIFYTQERGNVMKDRLIVDIDEKVINKLNVLAMLNKMNGKVWQDASFIVENMLADRLQDEIIKARPTSEQKQVIKEKLYLSDEEADEIFDKKELSCLELYNKHTQL